MRSGWIASVKRASADLGAVTSILPYLWAGGVFRVGAAGPVQKWESVCVLVAGRVCAAAGA